MKYFDYSKIISELYNPEIINLIISIHEYKGKQQLFIDAKPDILDSMLKIAKIQSTKASNSIEGIFTSDSRLNLLLDKKSEPVNRDEEEIIGYRKVLNTIHENYEFINLSPNIILQLHRDLYSYNTTSFSGKWKNCDNIIEEIDASGNHLIRFQPLPAFETPDAVKQLCEEFNQAINENQIDPLILIAKFTLDFLCIHPFNDGNGRMSRLLTLLLLYKQGYIVPKYISLEMIIEDTKEEYYKTLKSSSQDWIERKNSDIHFIKYYLSVILKSYKEFSSRVKYLSFDVKLTKSDRIKTIFNDRINSYAKSDILNICPDISKIMVEKTLSSLLKENYIVKIGQGKSTKYIRR